MTISDAGSFSAAGRSLGRVQSANSQAVKTLEDTQGVKLFDRSRKNPALTPVGKALVEQARTVLASADRFEAIAAGTRIGLEPALNLAIDPLVPTAPLIDSLRALRDTFPDALGADCPSYGVVGTRVWRFVDLARRLDFLLASFGWCKMPPFVIEPYLTNGRLVELDIGDESISPTGRCRFMQCMCVDALWVEGDAGC